MCIRRAAFYALILLVAVSLASCSSGKSETPSEGEGEGEGEGGEGEGEGEGEGSEGEGEEGEGEGSEGEGERPDDCRIHPEVCGDGEVCDTCVGVCRAVNAEESCEEHRNCRLSDYCDPCTKYCVPRKPYCALCGDDFECKEGGDRGGDLCYPMSGSGLRCLESCITDVGCDPCYRCADIEGLDFRLCVPVSGDCNQPCECESSEVCPIGEYCNTTRGLCAPGCAGDASCPGGRVCVDAQCVPPCATDEDCVAPAECGEDGKCGVPGECMTSRDCIEPQTYCDYELQECVPGCLVDNDCGRANLECIEHVCEEKSCEGNFQCAFGQVCNFDTGACEDAEGEWCAECDAQSQDAAQCGGEPNICVTFQDEDGNDLGDYCLVTCFDDPDNPCPQGYACREMQGQDGTTRSYCVRHCPFSPVTGGE